MCEEHALKVGKRKVVVEGSGYCQDKVVVFGGKAGGNGKNEIIIGYRMTNERKFIGNTAQFLKKIKARKRTFSGGLELSTEISKSSSGR